MRKITTMVMMAAAAVIQGVAVEERREEVGVQTCWSRAERGVRVPMPRKAAAQRTGLQEMDLVLEMGRECSVMLPLLHLLLASLKPPSLLPQLLLRRPSLQSSCDLQAARLVPFQL
jgi:hypothetical protein